MKGNEVLLAWLGGILLTVIAILFIARYLKKHPQIIAAFGSGLKLFLKSSGRVLAWPFVTLWKVAKWSYRKLVSVLKWAWRVTKRFTAWLWKVAKWFGRKLVGVLKWAWRGIKRFAAWLWKIIKKIPLQLLWPFGIAMVGALIAYRFDFFWTRFLALTAVYGAVIFMVMLGYAWVTCDPKDKTFAKVFKNTTGELLGNSGVENSRGEKSRKHKHVRAEYLFAMWILAMIVAFYNPGQSPAAKVFQETVVAAQNSHAGRSAWKAASFVLYGDHPPALHLIPTYQKPGPTTYWRDDAVLRFCVWLIVLVTSFFGLLSEAVRDEKRKRREDHEGQAQQAPAPQAPPQQQQQQGQGGGGRQQRQAPPPAQQPQQPAKKWWEEMTLIDGLIFVGQIAFSFWQRYTEERRTI